jgi:hypothetical protein
MAVAPERIAGPGIWLVGMEILAQWSGKDKVRVASAVPQGRLKKDEGGTKRDETCVLHR